MTAKLIVTAGANRGAQFALADRIIFNIGSDRGSTVFLDDPKVSPNHCRLYKEDSKYTLFDVSGKGLAVNGKKVVKAVLAEGDVVQIGDTEIRFTAADSGAVGGFGAPPAPAGAGAPPGYPPAAAVPPPGPPAEPRGYSRVWLQCVEGNDKGKSFDLTEGNVWVIGRGHSADITVMDIKVSRAHSRIDRVGNTFYLNDLNSTNGTFLNGQQIDRQVLHRGDYVKTGYTILSFQYEELAAAAPPYQPAPAPAVPQQHGWGPPPQAPAPGVASWGAPQPPPAYHGAPPAPAAAWGPPPGRGEPTPGPSAAWGPPPQPQAMSGPLREGTDAEQDYRFKSFLSYEEVDARADDRERLAGVSPSRGEAPRLPSFETGAQGAPPLPPPPQARAPAPPPEAGATPPPSGAYAKPPPSAWAPPPPAAAARVPGGAEDEDVPLDISALDDDDFGTGSGAAVPGARAPASAGAAPGAPPVPWGAPVAAASLPPTLDAWGAPAGGGLPPPPQRPGGPQVPQQRTAQLPAWNDSGPVPTAGAPPAPPPWGPAPAGYPGGGPGMPPPPQRSSMRKTGDMLVPDLDDDDLFTGGSGAPPPAPPPPGPWGAPPPPPSWGAPPPPPPGAWGAPPPGAMPPGAEGGRRHKTGELPVSDYLVRGGPAPPPISSEATAPLACFLCHRPFSQDDMRQGRLRRIKDHYYCLHCVQES